MNTEHQKQYEKRMQRVLAYIENTLDTPFQLDALCAVAAFSKFHFHRQFSAYTGMTVFKFIARKRLKRAAFQLLLRKEVSVTEIAFDAGFETVEAFSKAFKREIGSSPSTFRKDNDQLLTLDQIQPFKREGALKMPATTVDFKEIRVAVMEHVGSPNAVLKTVERFIKWRKENGLPPSKSRTFNLMYDDPQSVAPAEYRMDIGAELKGALKPNEYGVFEKTIPSLRCAYLRHIGSWETLEESVRYLFGEWLPKSGEEPADHPLIIERVTLYPEASGNALITDIYLPLE